MQLHTSAEVCATVLVNAVLVVIQHLEDICVCVFQPYDTWTQVGDQARKY